MLSPVSERPSIRELFHGSEEGIIPAENAKFNSLKNDTPDRIQHLASSPSAPTREQTSGPFTQASATSPARAQVSVEPLRFSPSQDAVQLPDIANYTTPELCLYLEQHGCSAETIEKVNLAQIDGGYWLFLFSQDMDSQERNEILVQSLLISDRLTKLKLSSEARMVITTKEKREKLKPSACSKPNNEKLPVPAMPLPLPGKTHITYSQWEKYRIAVVGWLQIGDKQMAAVADSLFLDPNQDIDNIATGQLSELQISIDTIWAVQLLQSPYVTEWHTANPASYTLEGHHSGLKIISTVGKLVNKKTSDRQLEAMNEALEAVKEPVKQPAKLHEALSYLHRIFNRMESLGSPADPNLKFTLLNQLVSELVTRTDMVEKLTIHISNCKEKFPNNAEKLFHVLMDKAENLVESYKPTLKLRRPRIAAAAQSVTPICPAYREGVKECRFGANCHRRHEGRSGKICDSEDFKKYGLCPKISQCPHMHPWDQAKFGDRREAITAYRKTLADAKKAKAEKQITAMALLGEDEDIQNAMVNATVNAMVNADNQELTIQEGEGTMDQIMAVSVPVEAEQHFDSNKVSQQLSSTPTWPGITQDDCSSEASSNHIVAMMMPCKDTEQAYSAAAEGSNMFNNKESAEASKVKITDEDVERLCQLAEEADFEDQMELAEGDSDTEMDYDSSDSDVGVTAKQKATTISSTTPGAPVKAKSPTSTPSQGAGKRLKLSDEDIIPEQWVIDMEWNNMTHEGHSLEKVAEWMRQSDKINKLVTSHHQVAAAMGPGHLVTEELREIAATSHLEELSKADFSIRMLLDGGTFNHNFGTDTKQYRVNIRKVEPIPIRTAGGIVWLNMMCDLCMPGIFITGGYINDHINITLISESVMAQKHKWTFHLDDKGKHISIQTPSRKRDFWAQMIGNLFYVPLEVALLISREGSGTSGANNQQTAGEETEGIAYEPDPEHEDMANTLAADDQGPATAVMETNTHQQEIQMAAETETSEANSKKMEPLESGEVHCDTKDRAKETKACLSEQSMAIEPEAVMVNLFDTRDKEFAEHCRCGHRPYLPGCPSCEAGYMQAKPARASKSSRKQLHTVNIDLLDLCTPDINGDRYVLDAVVQSTSYGEVELMKRKAPSVTVKHFAKIKNRIEANTAPGRPEEYQIGRVHRDQGSEFEGAMKQYIDEHNMINSWSEADRHTANALVEQRNKALAMTGAAINHGAVATDDEYIRLLQGESIRWANQIINNSPITQHQIETKTTAHSDQTSTLSPLTIKEIFTWGSLAYGFIPKDHRENKLSNRSFMGIWVGLDNEVYDGHRVVPILKDEGRWKLLPTKVCVKVKVYEGIFPLKMHPAKSNSLPCPAGPEQISGEELSQDAAEDEEQAEGEYEVEKVVEHVHGTERGTELRVRFKDYSPEYDLWYSREDLEGMCKEKVEQYIAENEPEFTDSLIKNETAAVIEMVRDMNRLAGETTVYQLKNGLPTDEETIAMAALATSMQTSIKGPDWHQVAAGDGMDTLTQQIPSESMALTMSCMVETERSKQPEHAKPVRAMLIQEAVGCPLDLAIKASNMSSSDISQAALFAHTLNSLRQQQHSASIDARGHVSAAAAEYSDLTFTEGGHIRTAESVEEMNIPYIPFVDQYVNSDGESVTDDMMLGMYAALKPHAEPLLVQSDYVKAHLLENGATTGAYAVTGQQTGQPGQNLTTILSNKEVMNHMGKDMIQTVGAVEIPIKQALAEDLEEAKIAIDKELTAMITTRKRLIPVAEENLTHEQKKAALELRFAITRKRVTPEQAAQGISKGTLKARLVAKDLKSRRKLPEEETFAGVPGMEAWRLIIASYNHETDRISTTDFDTAYLQTPPNGKLILTKRRCPFTNRWIYEDCTGVMYGMQTGGCEWKGDITHKLTADQYGFGFKELKNVSSVFYNAERDIIISIHVDDPLIKTKSKADEDWFHSKLREHYDVKPIKRLEVGSPIDYLSVRIQLHLDGSITLDNKDKITEFLTEHGMRDCNPVRRPLTKEDLMDMVNITGDPFSAGELKRYKTIIGQGNWLSQTTHPTLATATSILAGYSKSPTTSCVPVLHHYLRYLQHAKDYALLNHPGNTEGLTVESDSDWAGLYSAVGEVRSRSGTQVNYNGMPTGWISKLQKCMGTSMKPEFEELFAEGKLDEYEIATASAESELHAAAESLRLGLHIQHIAQELHLPVQETIVMKVDSTAAIGKIQGPRGSGKMKHIDLRDAWIQRLRCKKIVDVVKVAGTDNGADFFTKILTRAEFCKGEARLMTKIE